jgi:hypothetical protein
LYPLEPISLYLHENGEGLAAVPQGGKNTLGAQHVHGNPIGRGTRLLPTARFSAASRAIFS